jgi:hypothetical protein
MTGRSPALLSGAKVFMRVPAAVQCHRAHHIRWDHCSIASLDECQWHGCWPQQRHLRQNYRRDRSSLSLRVIMILARASAMLAHEHLQSISILFFVRHGLLLLRPSHLGCLSPTFLSPTRPLTGSACPVPAATADLLVDSLAMLSCSLSDDSQTHITSRCRPPCWLISDLGSPADVELAGDEPA